MNKDIVFKRLINNEEQRKRLKEFLYTINHYFYIPLDNKVNFNDYATKVLSRGIVLYAECNKNIIGILLGYANDMIEKKAYISTFGILDNHKSQGIGRRLLLEFKRVAIHNGMKRLALYTHKTNQDALRFYKNNGFKEEIDPSNRDNDIYLECKLL